MTKERLVPRDLNTNELSGRHRHRCSFAVSQLSQGATNELELEDDKFSHPLRPGQALPQWNGLKSKPDMNAHVILHKQGFSTEPSKPKSKVCHHP